MKIKYLRSGVLAADLVCIFGALALAIGLRYAGTDVFSEFVALLWRYSYFVTAAVAVWIPVYFEMNLDGFRGGWHFPAILSKLIVGVTSLMVVLLAFAFATNHLYSRLVLFYFSILFLFGTIVVRCLARAVVTSHLSNLTENRCVIVGSGAIARELSTKIASHPEFPFRVVGYLYPGQPDGGNGLTGPLGTPRAGIKTLGVLDLLTREKIQKLIIAMPQPNGMEIRKLIAQCRSASIDVYLVPDLYDLYLSKAELTEIDSLPLLSLRKHTRPRINFVLKRVFDVALTLGILVFVSPIFVLAILVVYAKKGRAFQTEPRCGEDAVPFRMFRLNIERHNPTAEPYERLFVRWSLTELPQLWNVLRSEMSLVGPRPESPERVKHYSDWQRQRLKVRAGVTGLAQVHGLRDQHPSEDKTRFDLQYIASCSPFLDLSIIVQTIWTLLSRGLIQEPAPLSEGSSPVHEKENALVMEEAASANRS
jgi:lipopolysaccharide/colanic/teichoic acid biosynthesis glycosyltransferase